MLLLFFSMFVFKTFQHRDNEVFAIFVGINSGALGKHQCILDDESKQSWKASHAVTEAISRRIIHNRFAL